MKRAGVPETPADDERTRQLHVIDGGDHMSSVPGFDVERAYEKLWVARGGEAIVEAAERETREYTKRNNAYKALRKYTLKATGLGYLSGKWTPHGLDCRSGYFWESVLAGQYLDTPWMSRMDPTERAWRDHGLPPLCCDRPEYVEALRNTWAYRTNTAPQTLLIKATTDVFGHYDGGFEVDPESIRWDKVEGIRDWSWV